MKSSYQMKMIGFQYNKRIVLHKKKSIGMEMENATTYFKKGPFTNYVYVILRILSPHHHLPPMHCVRKGSSINQNFGYF